MTTQTEKAARFLELHRPGNPLLLPNPWDQGSAKLLASLGFQALATTSSGFAATLGRSDGSVSRDEALAHAAAIELRDQGTYGYLAGSAAGRRAARSAAGQGV